MRRRVAIGLTLALILSPTLASDPPRARWMASFAWSMDAPWFGGFSGIELSPDGGTMTTITDRAGLITARIDRNAGRITAIRPGRFVPLTTAKGQVLTGRFVDSEGLAIGADSTVFVSFEGQARVMRYEPGTGRAINLPRPPAFAQMRRNGALEALAVDAVGRLFTLPERGVGADGTIPVYRWDGHGWSQPFSIPSRDAFRPVGADFGPDGRFYLLERAIGTLGFRSRLRRWTLTDTALTNEETLLTTPTGRHGNLEGVSIWRDDGGSLRATMIADDNFLVLQRSEIVEYELAE